MAATSTRGQSAQVQNALELPVAANGDTRKGVSAPQKEIDNIVANAQLPSENQNEWTSANGIVFEISAVPKLLLVDAGKKVVIPQPPNVFIEGKETWEPNPNDPAYIEAARDAGYRRGMVAVDIGLAFGTKVKKDCPLPDDVEPIESTVWSDDLLTMTGIEVPDKGRVRYIYWLKYHALKDNDASILSRHAMAYSGVVTQEEVVEAMVGFPDNETRSVDPGISDQGQAPSGD